MAYNGWRLTAATRAKLLERFPARFPDVVAHHITLSLKEGAPDHATVEVVGYTTDDVGLEVLLVTVNGSSTRPDGKRYHITWSLDRAAGYKPVDSNRILADHTIEKISPEIEIETEAFWVDNAKVEHVRIDDEAVVRAKERCRESGMDPNFIGTKGYPNYMIFTDEAVEATKRFVEETRKMIDERARSCCANPQLVDREDVTYCESCGAASQN